MGPKIPNESKARTLVGAAGRKEICTPTASVTQKMAPAAVSSHVVMSTGNPPRNGAKGEQG